MKTLLMGETKNLPELKYFLVRLSACTFLASVSEQETSSALGLRELPQQPGVPKATAAGLTQHELNQVAVGLLNGKVELRLNIDCIGLLRSVAMLD